MDQTAKLAEYIDINMPSGKWNPYDVNRLIMAFSARNGPTSIRDLVLALKIVLELRVADGRL